MRAMTLEKPRTPLVMRERPAPAPAPGEILIEIAACGVCRTDLHVVDGELPNPKLPIVPGHGGESRRTGHKRARRGPLARLDLRRLPLLPQRPREPVRSADIYRLHARRRLCHACARRCALLLPPSGAAG